MSRRRTVATAVSAAADYRYSTPAYLVAPGPTMFINGQVAWDEHRNVVGVGDFREQARQVFRNLRTILAAEDASLGDLVHMVIFVTDIGRTEDFVDVRAEFYGEQALPPSTIVQVAALMAPEMEIEIHATAVLSDGARPSTTD